MLSVHFEFCRNSTVALSLCFLASASGFTQTSGTRLHQLEQSSAAISRGNGSPAILASVVVQGAYDHDLAALADLSTSIANAQQTFISNPQSSQVTVLNVAAAFDAWRQIVKDPSTTPTSPVELFALRRAIAQVAPTFIAEDQDAQPSLHLSPAEAIYFFDFLIGHGGVPPDASSHVPVNTTAYDQAVTAYFQNEPVSQRQQDIEDIVNQFLLIQQ